MTLTPIMEVPHPCFCPVCGRKTSEVYKLPSNRHHILACGSCGIRIIGLKFDEKCPACSSYGPHRNIAHIEFDDPIPGNKCPNCP